MPLHILNFACYIYADVIFSIQPPSEMLQNWEEKEITYKDFIYKDLILYFKANLKRCILVMADGLKPSQRKVLHCSLKWDESLLGPQTVAAIAAEVAKDTNYHHREGVLSETIIKMAHSFVGSNNINLLTPIGQFGTRALVSIADNCIFLSFIYAITHHVHVHRV